MDSNSDRSRYSDSPRDSDNDNDSDSNSDSELGESSDEEAWRVLREELAAENRMDWWQESWWMEYAEEMEFQVESEVDLLVLEDQLRSENLRQEQEQLEWYFSGEFDGEVVNEGGCEQYNEVEEKQIMEILWREMYEEEMTRLVHMLDDEMLQKQAEHERYLIYAVEMYYERESESEGAMCGGVYERLEGSGDESEKQDEVEVFHQEMDEIEYTY